MWLRGLFRSISKAVNCFRKKVSGPQSCNFIKKETSTQLVSSEIFLREATVTTCSKIFQLCLLRTAQQIFDHLQLSQWQTNLKMYSLTKILLRAKSSGSIFSHFYFCRLGPFPLYQTAKVFLAFMERIIYYFHHKWASQ